MPVTAGLCLLSLVLGFLLGTRSRQLVASVKMLPRAVFSLAALSIPANEDSDIGNDNDDMTKEDEPSHKAGIEDFLSLSSDTGFEDFADAVFNPILLYQVKLAREALREKQRAEQLESMGSDPNTSVVLAESTSQQNALAVLVSVGARVLPVMAAEDVHSAALKEQKRQQRNIDSYLNRDMGVETRFLLPGKKGFRSKSAFEVANATKIVPYGGHSYERLVQNLTTAKESRNVLREWLRKNPHKNQPPEADDNEEDTELMTIKRKQGLVGGGNAIDPNMLAMIAAEFDDNGIEWGGEEEEEVE